MMDGQFFVLLIVIVVYGLFNLLVTATWGRQILKAIEDVQTTR